MREAVEYITPFLSSNGFARKDKVVMGSKKIPRFINDIGCEVIINEQYEHYSVYDKGGFNCHSDDLSIFWLIGCLIYFGFIKSKDLVIDDKGGVFYDSKTIIKLNNKA